MKLTEDELDFLAAWAREECEPACYQLPSHRLQLAHKASAGQLAMFIRAWADSEGKKDLDIIDRVATIEPRWPWTVGQFHARLTEAQNNIACRR
jgi:hypothetical protein